MTTFGNCSFPALNSGTIHLFCSPTQRICRQSRPLGEIAGFRWLSCAFRRAQWKSSIGRTRITSRNAIQVCQPGDGHVTWICPLQLLVTTVGTDSAGRLSVLQQVIEEGGDLSFSAENGSHLIGSTIALGQVRELRRQDAHSHIPGHIGPLQRRERHPA